MKINYKKLIFLFLGTFTLLTFLASAGIVPLIVEFEKTPLFSEANFLPGESIVRWIKITNNTGQSQKIAVQSIGVSDPDNLGDILNLEIKQNGIITYNDSLSNFFKAGEILLSDVGNASQVQYDFEVVFNSIGGNKYMGKSLIFDFKIGFYLASAIGGMTDITITSNGGGGGSDYNPFNQQYNNPGEELPTGEVAGAFTEREGISFELPKTGGSFGYRNTDQNTTSEEGLPSWVFVLGLIPVFLALYLNISKKRAKR